MIMIGIKSKIYLLKKTLNSKILRRKYSLNYELTPVTNIYRKKVKEGILTHDSHQEETIKIFDKLAIEYMSYEERRRNLKSNESHKKTGFFSRFAKNNKPEVHHIMKPKGLYVYGGVGCGKTMLMDLFLESIDISHKQRVHFNSFMNNFHSSVQQKRELFRNSSKNVVFVEEVANDIISNSPLLCFDEFQVTNIADAMIIGRLFDYLWKKGAVVVATSNRPPQDLYKNGLQRDLFLPFIKELHHHCNVHNLESGKDYRLLGEKIKNTFFVGKNTLNELKEVWNSLTDNNPGSSMELSLFSRKIIVPKCYKGVAMFSFEDLCLNPLGSADYAHIANKFHTILISNIPKMSVENKNEARRFITFVDEAYEHNVKLICGSEVERNELFPKPPKDTKGPVEGEEEMFAFERTVSRLHEMESKEYMNKLHVREG